MTHYVYSTLTASTVYTPCLPEGVENFKFNKKTSRILIHGGSNCAHTPRADDGRLQTSGALYTPRGVVTEVSDEEMEALNVNQHFLLHVKNGFIHCEKKELPVDKVVKNLKNADKSAPLTPKTLPKGIEEAEGPDGKKPGQKN